MAQVETAIRARVGDPADTDPAAALAMLDQLIVAAAHEVEMEAEYGGSSWEAAVGHHQTLVVVAETFRWVSAGAPL